MTSTLGKEPPTGEAVLNAVGRALNEPTFQGKAYNINVQDDTSSGEDHLFQRYWFPELSLGDYLRAAPASVGYGIDVGLCCYSEKIGCYAQISLQLSKSEAEARYEELARKYVFTRHALHMEDRSTLFSGFLESPEQPQLRPREAAIQKTIATLQATGAFANVFSPSQDYSISELRYRPEFVASYDTVICVYKRMRPEPKLPDARDLPQVVGVFDLSHLQRSACEYWDRQKRSWLQTVREDRFGRIPLIGGLAARCFGYQTPEDPFLDQLIERRPPAVSVEELPPDAPVDPSPRAALPVEIPSAPSSPGEERKSFFRQAFGLCVTLVQAPIKLICWLLSWIWRR